MQFWTESPKGCKIYQLIHTDTHSDIIDKLIDSLNNWPALHLASVVAAHFIALAFDVEV